MRDWLGTGAQPSDTVRKLLKHPGHRHQRVGSAPCASCSSTSPGRSSTSPTRSRSRSSRRTTARSCSSCRSTTTTTARIIGRGGRTAQALRTRRQGRRGQGQPPRPRRHRRVIASSRRGASAAPHGLDGSFHVTRPRGAAGCAARRACRPTRARSSAAPAPTSGRSCGSPASTTREAAEALRGQPLLVALDARPAARARRVVGRRARGLRVIDGEREVGPCGGCSRCRRARCSRSSARAARELLVPMVRDAVRALDVDGPRGVDVDLALPRGA